VFRVSPASWSLRRPFVLLLALTTVGCAGDASAPNSTGRTPVPVVEVIDGDTIRVDLDGQETAVRLIGIDTPERDGPYTSRECYGEEASRFTLDRLGGRTVELEFDVERSDRFGRTLAYVWLVGALFNERLVRSGFAVVTTFPPNVHYVERFTAAQRRARDEQRGLWGACGPA
jgi:micrococcal nuclease